MNTQAKVIPFPTPIHRLSRHLYGIRVPAIHYTIIKALADTLVSNTEQSEPLSRARHRCAKLALHAWKRAGA